VLAICTHHRLSPFCRHSIHRPAHASSSLISCTRPLFPPSAVFPKDPEGKLDTITPRLLFSLIQGLGVLFAVYKINQMGLLPTHVSDWVSSIKAPHMAETAVRGLLHRQ
jgi:hypothetical protein